MDYLHKMSTGSWQAGHGLSAQGVDGQLTGWPWTICTRCRRGVDRLADRGALDPDRIVGLFTTLNYSYPRRFVHWIIRTQGIAPLAHFYPGPFVPATFRTLDYSYPVVAPLAHSYPRPFVPATFHTLDYSYPGVTPLALFYLDHLYPPLFVPWIIRT